MDLFSSSSNNIDISFYSLDLNSNNHKNINRKRWRLYEGKNIIRRIKKIQKNQNSTNKKLDLILSIMKSKLLGEHDYKITHHDLIIYNENKNKKKEKKELDDSIVNDEDSPRKEKQRPKNLFGKKMKINSLDISGNLNLMIHDFLNQNNNDNNQNDDNIKNNNNNIIENNNIDNNNIDNISNGYNEEQKDISQNDNMKNSIKSDKISEEIKTINNNINSLLNNLSKIGRNEIDLNKYKFEPNTNTTDINDIKDNKSIENQNNDNEKKSNDVDLLLNQNKPETEIINNPEQKSESNDNKENKINENININDEINIKEKDDKCDGNKEEDTISQSDAKSVQSSVSNASSARKSTHNQNSSRKIRGFNFRNNIKIKKYNGNKIESDSSSSSANNNKKG